MALASGIGIKIEAPEGDNPPIHAWLFGEDQARYLVTVKDPTAFLAKAGENSVTAQVIGKTGGEALDLPGGEELPLSVLKALHESWLPTYMDGE